MHEYILHLYLTRKIQKLSVEKELCTLHQSNKLYYFTLHYSKVSYYTCINFQGSTYNQKKCIFTFSFLFKLSKIENPRQKREFEKNTWNKQVIIVPVTIWQILNIKCVQWPETEIIRIFYFLFKAAETEIQWEVIDIITITTTTISNSNNFCWRIVFTLTEIS